MSTHWRIIAVSTILYVIAFLLTTMWHELGHALAGVMAGTHPTLYNNYVAGDESASLSMMTTVGIKLAGPLFSLFQAAFCTVLFLRMRDRAVLALFALWMLILGFNNFFGYLFTALFARIGDIGSIVRLLEWPTAGVWTLAVAGMGGQLLVLWLVTRPFLEFMDSPQSVGDRALRLTFMRSVLIWPWLAGSVVFTLISMPSPAWLSTVYPLMSGMPFIMTWQAAGNPKFGSTHARGRLEHSSLFALSFVLIMLVVFNQFVLKKGLSF